MTYRVETRKVSFEGNSWCDTCGWVGPPPREQDSRNASQAARRHAAMTGHKTTQDRSSIVYFIAVGPVQGGER